MFFDQWFLSQFVLIRNKNYDIQLKSDITQYITICTKKKRTNLIKFVFNLFKRLL